MLARDTGRGGRAQARAAAHHARAVRAGRRTLHQGREHRRPDDAVPSARRRVDRRRDRRPREQAVGQGQGIPHRRTGKLRLAPHGNAARGRQVHRVPPHRAREERGVQPQDHDLRPELRRTQGGACVPAGKDPAAPHDGRGRHRGRTLHGDSSAQLHRAPRGGDRAHPEEAVPALPRLPARRRDGRERVPGRTRQGQGAREDREGGQEQARHNGASVGRDDGLHRRVDRGGDQEEEGARPQAARPHE